VCAGAYKNIRRGVFYESDFGPPCEGLHVSRTRLAVRTACASCSLRLTSALRRWPAQYIWRQEKQGSKTRVLVPGLFSPPFSDFPLKPGKSARDPTRTALAGARTASRPLVSSGLSARWFSGRITCQSFRSVPLRMLLTQPRAGAKVCTDTLWAARAVFSYSQKPVRP